MAKANEIEGLDCGGAASAGIRLVLRSRLEEMCTFREVALNWSDPEGVHDMRVASRRLRGAVKDFLPYLRKRKLQNLEAQLKWLADSLGAVRDQDVALMALEKSAAEAPADVSVGLEQFANSRRLRRDRARLELEQALSSESLDELRDEFNTAHERGFRVLRRKRKGEDQVIGDGISFRQAGRDIISSRLKELQQESSCIYDPLKSKQLHQLRLAAKRLRYACELFSICWNDSLAPFAKEIAKLQTSLGEMHDSDVWISDIGALLRSSTFVFEEARKRDAAFWLLDYFVKKRANDFRDALARWRVWERTSFQAGLLAVLYESRATPAVRETDSPIVESGLS